MSAPTPTMNRRPASADSCVMNDQRLQSQTLWLDDLPVGVPQ